MVKVEQEQEKDKSYEEKLWQEIAQEVSYTNQKLTELAEASTRGEIIQDRESWLFWTEEEARKVAEFLQSLPPVETPTITRRQAEPLTVESYLPFAQQKAREAQEHAFGLLRRHLGLDPQTGARAGLRSRGHSGFSQEDKRVPLEDGGTRQESFIYVPRTEEVEDLSFGRIREGLARMIAHVLRSQTNPAIWGERELPLNKSEKVGGYKVGSNRLGSEAVSDLMAILVAHLEENAAIPTIEDILPEVEKELERRLNNFKPKVTLEPDREIKGARYLAANIALLHHLRQLADQGCGGMPITHLLAIGVSGYTSLEKSPQLIETGIFNSENAARMEEVVLEIAKWLVENI